MKGIRWISIGAALFAIAGLSGCGCCGLSGANNTGNGNSPSDATCPAECSELTQACEPAPDATALADPTIGPKVAMVALANKADKTAAKKGDEKVPAVLNFRMKSLDGKEVDLAKYQGKVVLFVNVASRCGYTPQYKTLETLHEKYADQGLAIVGVPANEFGKQEPGTNEEIAEFCSTKYGVKFDMLAKVVVKGESQCELYKFLTSKDSNAKFAGDIGWNFEKFLISKKGEVVARFPSKVKPDSPEMVKAIEAELAK